MKTKAQTRVLLADDSARWIEMMTAILADTFEIVATASTGKSALKSIGELRPDVAVLDLEMPGLSGMEVMRELMNVRPLPAIVICSAHFNEELVNAATTQGAHGYVRKTHCARDLVNAVKAAANGLHFLSAA
jgi:DNA-binding NarL/FixJ family response regulator